MTHIKKSSLSAIVRLSILLAATLSLSGCGVYSFTGASIPPEAKTFSVGYFQNVAQVSIPALSNLLTEELKLKFIRQTKLNLVPSEGDLAFEGEITGFSISPIAVTSNDFAQQDRVTVTIRVVYTSKYDKAQDFNKNFSRFYDRPGGRAQSPSEETQMFETLVADLVEDIFNASVANW